MDNSKSILETIEYIFDCANNYYYKGELEKPIFGLSTSKGSYGHITVESRWSDNIKDGKRYRELNINPDHLNRPLKDVVATVLHEMAHLRNIMLGINDCNGYYHNKKFKEEAEKLDLIIEKSPKYGWSTTIPTPQTALFIMEFKINKFKYSRNDIMLPWTTKIGTTKIGTNGTTTTKKGKPKGSNSIKYECPVLGCKCIARTTKATKLICGEHLETMVTKDIDEDE